MKKTMFLLGLMFVFSLYGMEENTTCLAGTIDSFNETIENTNYSEHNLNSGHVCTNLGCAACGLGILLNEIAVVGLGAMCCCYAARNYAVSWNATTFTSNNRYVRSMQNTARWLFCLEMHGVEGER